jgi:aldehyde dehydrogenase (NAD+)
VPDLTRGGCGIGSCYGTQIESRWKSRAVGINTYNMIDPVMPFGGFKASGSGRDCGAEALTHYTQTKSVWVKLDR